MSWDKYRPLSRDVNILARLRIFLLSHYLEWDNTNRVDRIVSHLSKAENELRILMASVAPGDQGEEKA